MPYVNPEDAREQKRRWREANKDKVLALAQRYRERNRERLNAKSRERYPKEVEWRRLWESEYRKKRPDVRAKANSNWSKSHPEQKRAHVSARSKRTRRATPSWADQTLIRAVYLLAGAWRRAGFDVHVDHILPLAGDLVSGLHVIDNLTILSAAVNIRKGNRANV